MSRVALRWQMAILGTLAVGGPVGLWWLLTGKPGGFLLFALFLVSWVAWVLWWFGQRSTGHLLLIEQQAHRVRRGETNAMPVLDPNPEWFAASLGIRQMVDGLKQRQQVLELENVTLGQRVIERTQELHVLSDIAKSLALSGDERTLMQEMLVQLEQAIAYTSASLWARDTGHVRSEKLVRLLHYRRVGEDQPNPQLFGLTLSGQHARSFETIERERQPLVVNSSSSNVISWLIAQVFGDARSEKLYQTTRSWMAVPLVVKDALVGVLRLDHHQPNFFDHERQRLLVAIGHQTALAIQHGRLHAQAKQLAVLGERNRIARDLHDAVSQSLFASSMAAETLLKTSQDETLHRQLLELQSLNRGALSEMRLLLYELRPDALEHASLGELLRHAATAAASRNQLGLDLRLDERFSPPQNIKIELYRIAQEALSNITQHAQATHFTLEFECPNPQRCRLCIEDDGQGFVLAKAKTGHFGLINMRERAKDIDAHFEISSRTATDGHGHGTQISVIWQPDEAIRQPVEVP